MIDKSNFLGKTATPKTRGGSRPASRSASINRERSDSSSRFSTKEPEGFVWAPLSSQNPNHYIWAPLSQEDLFDNSVKDLPINVKPRLSKKTGGCFSSKQSSLISSINLTRKILNSVMQLKLCRNPT